MNSRMKFNIIRAFSELNIVHIFNINTSTNVQILELLALKIHICMCIQIYLVKKTYYCIVAIKFYCIFDTIILN